MEALRDLGFSADESLAALKRSNGNVDEAANFLFSLSEFQRQALVTASNNTTPVPGAVLSASLTQDNERGPVKMVLCVRQDLSMSAGKMCAQCSHAAVGLCESVIVGKLRLWKDRWAGEFGSAKIVLGVQSEEELLRLAEHAAALKLPFHIVQDAGRTQVEPGTRTVLGIGPAPSALIDQVTGTLSLL